jgi:hypothetical protein
MDIGFDVGHILLFRLWLFELPPALAGGYIIIYLE